MLRITALLAVAATALALVASIGAAPAAPVKLSGSVGPGETIVSTIANAMTVFG